MSLRCKPGDLAVIIGAKNPENNGVFVDVLAYAGDGPSVVHEGINIKVTGPAWIVRAKHGQLMTRAEGTGRPMYFRSGPIADCCLQPIRPPAKDTTTTQTKEKVHESS